MLNYMRKKSDAEQTKLEIEQEYRVAVHLVKANVKEMEQIRSLFQETEQHFWKIGCVY
ncbi:hypothetical protein GCM10020331_069440 [Ectobacillus funiculus]